VTEYTILKITIAIVKTIFIHSTLFRTLKIIPGVTCVVINVRQGYITIIPKNSNYKHIISYVSLTTHW